MKTFVVQKSIIICVLVLVLLELFKQDWWARCVEKYVPMGLDCKITVLSTFFYYHIQNVSWAHPTSI